MRPILSLAGWNWRMARRPYAILCAVFAAQQLAVLLVQAQDPDNTGRSLANLYRDGVQFLAFGLAFLLAGLLAGPASSDQKRARCSYTWLTLPLPSAARLAGQVLAAAVLQLGVVALQLVLYAASAAPVRALARRAMQAWDGTRTMPELTFYEEVIINYDLYWLIPRRPGQAAAMLFTVLAAALLLTAVRLHKGWRRAVAVGIGVVCALACADVLDAEKLLRLYPAEGIHGTDLVRDAAVLAVLLPFSVWWALRAIRRAEPACT